MEPTWVLRCGDVLWCNLRFMSEWDVKDSWRLKICWNVNENVLFCAMGKEGCTFYSSVTIWRSFEREVLKSVPLWQLEPDWGVAHLHLITLAAQSVYNQPQTDWDIRHTHSYIGRITEKALGKYFGSVQLFLIINQGEINKTQATLKLGCLLCTLKSEVVLNCIIS